MIWVLMATIVPSWRGSARSQTLSPQDNWRAMLARTVAFNSARVFIGSFFLSRGYVTATGFRAMHLSGSGRWQAVPKLNL
jgi:hypothetical protein